MSPRPTGLGWALLLGSLLPATTAGMAATSGSTALLWATVLAALGLTCLAALAAAALADQQQPRTAHHGTQEPLAPVVRIDVIRSQLPTADGRVRRHQAIELPAEAIR